MSAPQIDPALKGLLKRLTEETLAIAPEATENVRYAKDAPKWATAISEKWKSLHNVDQVIVGMSFVGAAMGVLNAWSYGRNSVSHNEQGDTTIRPTMVGLALLHTALALGSAIIGAVIMKNAHARY